LLTQSQLREMNVVSAKFGAMEQTKHILDRRRACSGGFLSVALANVTNRSSLLSDNSCFATSTIKRGPAASFRATSAILNCS
jgi:hypothetical protein